MDPQLAALEEDIQHQLDRLYQMAEMKKPAGILQIEYKRTVELFSQKYQLLISNVEAQKADMGEEAATAQANALREEYKDTIVQLAVAVDEAAGLESKET